MDIQKAREKFAEINLKEGFYTEEELSITDLGVFEYTAAEQDWEKWWECLIYYVEPMQQAQKVAVPEGFVLLSHEDIARLMNTIDFLGVKALGDEYISFSEIHKIVEEWQEQNKAMIEAQEQNNA